MKITNEEGNDFSNEIMVQLAMVVECVFASQIVCYKLGRDLDRAGIKGTFFQKHRQALNQAKRNLEMVNRQLEVAFDRTICEVITKSATQYNEPDYLQHLANDVVELLLIYFARSEGDADKRNSMKKALKNFKPSPYVNMHEILKYYEFED